jgi:uncharacterized membrane protein HdeD (DUF308 family)
MTSSDPSIPAGSAANFSVVRIDLAKTWPLLLLRGGIAILFGLVAIIWPGITAVALAILFGAYVVVDGVGLVIDAVRVRELPHRLVYGLLGVLSVIAGLGAFVWPEITAVVLASLVGAWALIGGVLTIVAAIRFRRVIRGELFLGLAGALSALAGILILVRPDAGARAIALVIGFYALLAGVLLTMLALRLRRTAKQPTA